MNDRIIDANLSRLQSIPQFLPVMRGTLSLPAMRDPEVLERLQPNHILNMCTRLQVGWRLSIVQLVLINYSTVTLQFVRDKNRTGPNCDQHEDQGRGSRYQQAYHKNDRKTKAVRSLRRNFLASPTNIATAESVQYAAESEHRTDGVIE